MKFISTYTYGVLSVVCMRCGKSVRKKELDAHNYWTHGIGKRPSDPVRQSSVPKRSAKPPISSGTNAKNKTSNRLTVVCKVCNQSVRQSRLEKHILKAHPGLFSTTSPVGTRGASPAGRKLPNGTMSTKPITECEVCSIPIRLDRLDAHMQRVHPTQAALNNTSRARNR